MLMTTALLFVVLPPQGGQAAPAAAAPTAVQAWVDAELDELVALYRHFHRYPELSFFEERTAARYADELEAAGLTVTRGVGGHGVVGVVENGDGPTLMLRADLDGLPLQEQTGLDYASQARQELPGGEQQPVMHACGHDLHMTNLIGAVRYLAAHRGQWRGTLLVIGQPAEERGSGALLMLRAGLFRRFPKPDFALALHVHPMLPAGTVGYRAGAAMANVDSCDIELFGKGGHGAYPHLTIDPIAQAAQLVVALQTIVSREVSPLEPAVVTVGSIHGGAKHNIIPDRCALQLTVRSYSDEVHARIKAAIERKAKAIADSVGAPPPVVEFSESVPALVNDDALTERVAAAFRRALGEEAVQPAEPVMGAEDFAYYGREGVAICMFRLGTISPERIAAARAARQPLPPLHSPFFAPDAAPSLRGGVVAMVAGALELLGR